MDKVEDICKQIFTNDIQLKRITKEMQHIEQLKSEEFKITMKTLNTNLQIIVEMPPMKQINFGKPIVLAIFIDSKFPFVFPQVHCLSDLTKPSLSDGRDFIEDIIHQPWTPSILLYEIIKSFPKFLETVRINNNNKEFLLSLGKYYIDKEYELQLGLVDADYYDYIDIKDGKQRKRIMQISSHFILNIEYQQNIPMLIAIYQTKDLVKLDKTFESILLSWKNQQDIINVQTIITEEVDALYLQLVSWHNEQFTRRISKQEVTIQKFESFSINNLLNNVKATEQLLNEELNKESLNNLLSLYQQAIEYYSAFSDEEYKQYVSKLQSLIAREDVQNILAAPISQ